MDYQRKLAPVILFCYNRPKFTIKTIKALEQNNLSSETDLYIFIDGPKTKEDTKKINEIYEFVNTLNSFKKIIVNKSEINKGLAVSVINGVSTVMENYDKVIVLEDDLITHPYFLTFMNNSLDYYYDEKNIWSISGYSPTINLPKEYTSDTYYTKRGSSWGWATWKEKWRLVNWEWEQSDFKKFYSKKREINKIGQDIYYLTKDYEKSLIDSWAIRWTNTQFNLNMYSVFPQVSLIENIGFGNDSTHGNLTKSFATQLTNNEVYIELSKNSYSIEIEKEYAKLYKLRIHNRVAILLKYLGIYSSVKTMLKKYLK